MTGGVGNIAVVGSGKHLPTGWTTSRSVLDLQSVPGCTLVALVEPDPTERAGRALALGVPTDAAFATVAEMLAQQVATIGENIKVRRFVRFVLGEGLEKKVDDFAAEVAAQVAAAQKAG